MFFYYRVDQKKVSEKGMWGEFWKIQDVCYQMGNEIFKIEEKMTEKIEPKVESGKIFEFFTETNRSVNFIELKKVCNTQYGVPLNFHYC